MNVNSRNDQALINRLTAIVEANLSDEQFGVNEFAAKTGFSRSQLHRKLKSCCNKSVSQFIREVRLEKAKEFLEQGNLTVSEIAYKVGFGSPSYFIKSFHDLYGYSPGRIGSGEIDGGNSLQEKETGKRKIKTIALFAFSVIVLVVLFILIFKPFPSQKSGEKISIAVLPVICDLPDTCQFTVLNQISQNVINNLCLVNEINPKPWSSLRQYSSSDMSIPEIVKEQHVRYVVEPQVTNVLNDRIQLNVNLIEGNRNTQISTNSVNLDYSNAAITVQDFTKVLLKQLKVKITPEVYRRVNKVITTNPEALRLYWEGTDLTNQWLWDRKSGVEKLEQAINLFEKALQLDHQFVLAYAQMAITFCRMKGAGMDDGTLPEKIESNSRKAFSLDSLNDQSLVSRAYYHLIKGEDEKAVRYFEKALEYNPNSPIALRALNHIYMGCSECVLYNSEKQLEYALRVIHSEIPENSRIGLTKVDYYRLGKSFRNAGFNEEGYVYINKALEIDSNYVIALYEIYATNIAEKGYRYTIEKLKYINQKEPANPFTLNQIWIKYYVMQDFDSAMFYMNRAFRIAPDMNAAFNAGRLSLLYSKKGDFEEAKKWKEKYFEYAQGIQSSMRYYHMAAYFSLIGDIENVYRQMTVLCNDPNIPNWAISNLKNDPIFEPIRNQRKFQRLLSKIEKKFLKNHERIKDNLEKKGLL